MASPLYCYCSFNLGERGALQRQPMYYTLSRYWFLQREFEIKCVHVFIFNIIFNVQCLGKLQVKKAGPSMPILNR